MAMGYGLGRGEPSLNGDMGSVVEARQKKNLVCIFSVGSK